MSVKIVMVVGPTAVGKTSLAVALAQQLNGEIIHADSRQVYRLLDIGTAKPTSEELTAASHHLLDLVDPTEYFSAGQFLRAASQKIATLTTAKKTIIVEGGTGLYLQTLIHGLAAAPPRNDDIRTQLMERVEQEGLAPLHKQLAAVDPTSAKKIQMQDQLRIIRALEVWLETGEALSSWQQKTTDNPGYDCKIIGLSLERATLYERINQRVDLMLTAGWLPEVDQLLEQGYTATDPGMQAVGYRQLIQYRQGTLSWENAVSLTKRDTRRFAKRQLTWFRKNQAIHWYNKEKLDQQQLVEEVNRWLTA